MNLKEVAKEIRDILSERQKELCLTFEEDKHRYTMKDVDGKIRDDFPSVSKVMKLFYDGSVYRILKWFQYQYDPILLLHYPKCLGVILGIVCLMYSYYSSSSFCSLRNFSNS